MGESTNFPLSLTKFELACPHRNTCEESSCRIALHNKDKCRAQHHLQFQDRLWRISKQERYHKMMVNMGGIKYLYSHEREF